MVWLSNAARIDAADEAIASVADRLNDPCRWQEFKDQGFNEDVWWACEVQRRMLRLRALASVPDAHARHAIIEAERLLCAADPIHWIENYVWIEDPKQDQPERRELPLVLWPAQVQLVHRIEDSIRRGVDLVIVKGRELGASWICQTMLLHHFCFEDSRFLAKSVSRKEAFVDDRTVDSLFGKYRYIIERLPGFIRPSLTRDKHMLILNGRTGSQLSGESTNEDLGRGGRQRVMFLDEFARVDPGRQESVFLATETVASARIFASTPAGPGNRFAKLLATHHNVFEMSWESDPRRDDSWKAKKAHLDPLTFEQEHGAKVVTLGSGRIWHARRTRDEYRDSDPRFRPEWRDRMGLICGWDFGSGASRLVCLFALVQPTPDGRFRLWLDSELHWEQASWRQASADVLALYQDRYKGHWAHFGDPAGTSPESDQESWESNLRRGRIPMVCLPDDARTREANEWGIKAVQAMLDDELLMVHRRCSYVWDCLDNWRRQLPQGLEMDHVSKTYFAPRHDVYSHGAMALTYLIRGAVITHEEARANTVASAEAIRRGVQGSPSAQIKSMLREIRSDEGSPYRRRMR